MLILYALTSFLSAALLFLVQPMIAKLLLPMLGGGPSVWNVCMVFFQAGLLAGYGYTHLLARRARAVRQVILHIAIVALTLLWLPIGLGGGTVPGTGAPFLWLLGALVASVGLPFFVLSTTGPLLQHWLASTDHPRAKDPYSLYAASNAGSLVGLLAFPAILEPLLRARTQAVLWSMGYLAFAGLVVTCGVVMVTRRAAGPHGPPTADVHAVLGSSIPMATRLRWLLLAFAPSSLLLGATLHITTDVAAIPLFWVVPLAVYLLTFIIAFSPRATGPSQRMSAALAIVALVAAASLWGFSLVPLWAKFPIHVLTVFTGGLVCHGQLARERPAPDRLTEFYLLVALGGVLGGVFNALIAPLVFNMVAEYPIALVLACLLRPEWKSRPTALRTPLSWALDLAIPAGVALLWLGIAMLCSGVVAVSPVASLILQIGIPGAFCLGLMRWRLRFALGLAVLLAIGAYQTNTVATALLRERTFFGVSRVVRATSPRVKVKDGQGHSRVVATTFNVLLNGSTKHGSQNLEPSLSGIPTSYFHPSGPIGQIFTSFQPLQRLDRVGIVGLGAGTLATYGRPGDRFTFYEIDSAVIRIARDSGLFTYLKNCKAEVRYVVGDGRLSLTTAADGEYGMIVVDAFSSDAVPVHLLTREAFQLYFRKLRPDGLLALNISNHDLAIDDVVFAVAADLGFAALTRYDDGITPEQALSGKNPSMWAVVARNREALGPLANDPVWSNAPGRRERLTDASLLWTDDFSNVIGVIRIR